VGLTLLLPPTRAIVRRVLIRRMGWRVVAGGRTRTDYDGRARTDYDVEGSAREYDDEPTRGLER
jgi:UPF0716 family protein affecting phage T7 exclusion